MLEFCRRLPSCLIGIEACASAHYCACELTQSCHGIRLMQPGYVKRGKTDAADAEPIADFQSGSDLSAWLGLTPRPHSTGGKEQLGRITTMGNRYLRPSLSAARHSQYAMARNTSVKR